MKQSTLIISPVQEERQAIVQHLTAQGLRTEEAGIGRVPVVHVPELRLTLAKGGLGKVQFAVTTQHLIDMQPDWHAVICAGAAGALADDVAVGDVVVGTATAEHDFRKKFGKHRIPTYRGASQILHELRQTPTNSEEFSVHFGKIASGDEDIGDAKRRREVHELTDALAVAWEGIGGARACHFTQVPFVEIRGITDAATGDVPAAFKANLQRAMGNVATVLMAWAHKHA
jgi:adenosylhomocysteine nucleosidase